MVTIEVTANFVKKASRRFKSNSSMMQIADSIKAISIMVTH